MTLNPRKSSFRMRLIKFLGLIVSDKGISPDPKKVDSIGRFSRPGNTRDCRSFLRLMNFVGQFIPHLATVADPIRDSDSEGGGVFMG